MNDRAKGDHICLCYKKTDNKSETITRIFFLHGEDAPKPEEYDIKLDQDLNDGANGEYIYLCYRRRSDEDPITDLEVISGKENTITPPDGYIRINDDLNSGAGGSFVYLCYKPANEVKRRMTAFRTRLMTFPPILTQVAPLGAENPLPGVVFNFFRWHFEHYGFSIDDHSQNN